VRRDTRLSPTQRCYGILLPVWGGRRVRNVRIGGRGEASLRSPSDGASNCDSHRTFEEFFLGHLSPIPE
jgi:hypothetical protein